MPSSPSVGSHCGKQSSVSANVRLRTMTLPTFWIWSMPPVMPALVPGTPTIVVLAGTLKTMFAACFFCAAARADSWVPEGSLARPYADGSYAFR